MGMQESGCEAEDGTAQDEARCEWHRDFNLPALPEEGQRDQKDERE